MTHWATDYIGKPWQAGSKGPDQFDCWGLMIAVNKQQFDRDLPDIPPALAGNLTYLARTFKNHPERQRWQQVGQPQHGDAVLLRQSRHPIHVGIWLKISNHEQGVLHCVKGSGVVFQSIQSLKLTAWQIAGFYRFKDHDEHTNTDITQSI